MSVRLGKLGSRRPTLAGRAERVTFEAAGADGSAVLEQLSHGGARVSDARPRLRAGERIELRIPVGGALALLCPAEVIEASGSGFTARWLPGNPLFERFLDKSLGPARR